MKNILIGLLFVLPLSSIHSQSTEDKSSGRFTSSVKQEKIIGVRTLSELIPDYPGAFYSTLINYVSVVVVGTRENKVVATSGINDTLSDEQTELIRHIDLGTDLGIYIKFSYKNPDDDNRGSNRKIKEMQYRVMVNPEIEAEFPGGYKKMIDYLTENVLNTNPVLTQNETKPRSSVSFAVNELGDVVKVKLILSSGDPKADKHLLDAIHAMPRWKAAENSKGIKVEQNFRLSLPFNKGC